MYCGYRSLIGVQLILSLQYLYAITMPPTLATISSARLEFLAI